MSRLFFDNNDNFQWASIAALIAFIVGCFSVYNNRKTLRLQKDLNKENFKGNIVSKSRIEWIQEVRKRSVDFISTCYDLIEFIKSNRSDSVKLRELHSNVEKSSTLLILYFGPDKDKNNDFIVYLVTLLSEKLMNKDEYYSQEHIIGMSDEIDVLKYFLRVYFKIEWKRATGEIEDSQVQSYLESDDDYAKIMKIYESGFESHKEWMENYYCQLEDRYLNK